MNVNNIDHVLPEIYSTMDLTKYEIHNNCETFKQCEICYKTEDCLLDILTVNLNGKTISYMLDNFPSIKEYRLIENSFNLCVECIKQLITAYLFLEKLKESNKRFNGLLKLNNIFKHIEIKNNNCTSKYNSVDVTDEISNEAQTIKQEDVSQNHLYFEDTDNNNCKLSDNEESEKIEIQIQVDEDIKKQFICEVCGTEFKRKQSLELHIRRIHLKEKTFKCANCEKSFFLESDFNRHILLHSGETSHMCDVCGKAFVTENLLKAHRNTVHIEKEIKCSLCPKFFKIQSQLKRHVAVVHELKRHPSDKERYVKTDCSICGKKINKYILKNHMETHSETKQYKCEICDQEFFCFFSQKSSLQRHILQHQEPKFKCEYCGKQYFAKENMKTHVRRHHTREIVCACHHCGKGFVHRNNLKQHIRNCHPSETEGRLVEPKIPKQCNICGKMYSSRTSLIHHTKRVHENKQYPCTECSMPFRNDSSLRSHLKKVHNIGEFHKCQICCKIYHSKDELCRHTRRTHRKGSNSLYLSCTLCLIKFKTKHDLIQHIQGQHLNCYESDLLYECTVCTTLFIDEQNFNKHLTEHSYDSQKKIIMSEYSVSGIKVKCFHVKLKPA